ncbi:MAG: hypothetical protein IKS51_03240 [Erysipelotrichaceae bacterium]|nr:hypothetical protein [Erysipelotrichaceae bacterium]
MSAIRYDRSTAKDKWTIMMYMRDFDLMLAYAYALRASNRLTNDNIDEILYKMEDEGIYRPRNGGSTFTGTFKSIQIAWYMFGYYNKSRRREEEKKMVFSPLGNLLLDNLKDRDKVTKIFLTMLYGNGFRQPFSQMNEQFNLFPFRLVFKLLRDPRLQGRLYNDEVFYLVMFMKTITPSSYEALVSDILELRNKDPFEKFREFKTNERVVGLALHEWRYATGMFESAGIVKICNDNNDRTIGQLTYGNVSQATGRPNAVRNYKEDYIVLQASLKNYVDTLLSNYPYYVQPYPEDELSRSFNNDIVVEMYSFYPPELLNEIGMNTEEDKAIATMLNVANNVYYYSHEETETGVNFEDALVEAFNMFFDIEARRIGGAGNVDVECLFHTENDSIKKFDLEAKSTRTKLLQINARRLRTHRSLVNSKYTMIVTPNYAIGVLRDISGDQSVIIKAATLANYLYQYILKNGREISYSVLDEVIENGMGSDITDSVNAYVYDNFGHGAADLTIRPSRTNTAMISASAVIEEPVS